MTRAFARHLRQQMTEAERRLWSRLRRHGLAGLHFRRQHPIGAYVVDFICLERRLIVEVDGGQHADNSADERRTAWLEARGFRLLRCWNNEVLHNTDGVCQAVLLAIEEAAQIAERGMPPP